MVALTALTAQNKISNRLSMLIPVKRPRVPPERKGKLDNLKTIAIIYFRNVIVIV